MWKKFCNACFHQIESEALQRKQSYAATSLHKSDVGYQGMPENFGDIARLDLQITEGQNAGSNFVIDPRGYTFADQDKVDLFRVDYDNALGNYVLTDLQAASRTFMKIEQPTCIASSMMVTVGDLRITLQVDTEQIRVDLPNLPNQAKSSYSFSNDAPSRITFGRAEDCDVCLQGFPGISRYHFGIWFEKSRGWHISDGDGSRGNASTNGTWYLVESPVVLSPDQSFKAGRSVFLVKLD